MRHSPTGEKARIVDLRVTGIEKRKELTKHSEYVLRITWSNERQYRIFRRYSMFFDLQAGLRQIFQEKHQIAIPDLPAAKFISAGRALFGGLSKKGCKYIEEFCQKIIQLPPTVSESEIVLRFFSEWGTDAMYCASYVPDSESSAAELNSAALPSSLSQPNDKVESALSSEQYKSIAQFEGGNTGELTMKENEIVTVIEKNQAGWWFVMNERGDQGFAPATFLEPLDPEVSTEAEEWNSKVEESERFWVTTVSYTAQSSDEVSYKRGEQVELLATSNFGWWKIRCKGKVGLTAAANLVPKGETDLPATPYASFQRKRTATYSSISGIYASIRKPPPRRESVKNKGNVSKNQAAGGKSQIPFDSNRRGTLQYAEVEILPASKSRPAAPPSTKGEESTLSEMEPEYAKVLPKHLRAHQTDHSEEQRKNVHKGTNDTRQGPSLVISLPMMKKGQAESSAATKATVVMDESHSPDKKKTVSDKHKYVNMRLADRNKDSHKEQDYYVATVFYTPPDDRIEDLELNKGDVVQLLSVDGPWYFVSTTGGKTQTNGWVPASILTACPSKDQSQGNSDVATSLKGNDVSRVKPRVPRPPPRPDKLSLDNRKHSLEDTLSPPDEPCPPLPGMPITDTLERNKLLLEKEKLSKAYIAICDYTNVAESCISFRKGEVGILLEINELGWWLMSIAGVEGWTPGEYWEALERKSTNDETQHTTSSSHGKDFESEVWFHGKMARPECESMMLQAAEELEFIVRESPQRVASYVLSIRYSGKIRHFPVEVTASGKCVIGRHAFNSLSEVVAFYRNHALFYTQTREAIRLGDPFKRPRR